VKCLVTGATGFLGRELCAHLQQRGHSLLALSRSGRQPLAGCPVRALDLAGAAVDPQLLQGVEVVFHLAGIAHQRADAADYEQVNHLATVALARAARDVGVRCFVFVSSVKAMGESRSVVERSEKDCQLPRDLYGLSKWRAEAALRAEFDGSDMAVRIIRPALVYGVQARGNLRLLARAVQWGLPRPPADGARSMIALPDLVCLLEAVGQSATGGTETWIATDGHSYSTRAIYDMLRERAGKRPGVAWAPRACWRLAARCHDLLFPTRESIWKKMFATELYSNDAICRALGWRPQLRLEDVALRFDGEHRS